MKEHSIDLDMLAKKYQERITSLENELNEEKRKLNLVSEAITLLRREGIYEQEKLFENPTVSSDRYKDMSMKEAIEDILRSYQPEKLPVDLIYSDLVTNGFKSESKNLRRDLYSRLSRLEDDGILDSIKRGRVKKYFLPKTEEEKKEETITK
jgi:aspartate/glutamate racemase